MRLIRWQRPALHRLPNFGRLADWQDEIDRLFGLPLAGLTETARKFGGRTPALDVSEDKDNYVVTAELPGLKREAIDVNVQDGVLTISGEQKHEPKSETAKVYRAERSVGRFQRTLTLPLPVAAETVRAVYQDGVLTVTLPKAEVAKPKQIKVSVN